MLEPSVASSALTTRAGKKARRCDGLRSGEESRRPERRQSQRGAIRGLCCVLRGVRAAAARDCTVDRLRHRSARQRPLQGSESEGSRRTRRILRQRLVVRLEGWFPAFCQRAGYERGRAVHAAMSAFRVERARAQPTRTSTNDPAIGMPHVGTFRTSPLRRMSASSMSGHSSIECYGTP